MQFILMGLILLLVACTGLHSATTTTPVSNCMQTSVGVENLICNTPALATLDQQLNALYQAALGTYPAQDIALLKTRLDSWITERNDCLNDSDPTQCVSEEYVLLISELQVTTGALPAPDRIVFRCADGSTLGVYFYRDTLRPLALIHTTDDRYFAFLARSASGARYLGRNISFWNKGRDVMWEQSGNSQTCSVEP